MSVDTRNDDAKHSDREPRPGLIQHLCCSMRTRIRTRLGVSSPIDFVSIFASMPSHRDGIGVTSQSRWRVKRNTPEEPGVSQGPSPTAAAERSKGESRSQGSRQRQPCDVAGDRSAAPRGEALETDGGCYPSAF